METVAPHLRFREARERSRLSTAELAAGCGVSHASIWDIETCEGDLTRCYSPRDLQRFAAVLGVRPAELFGEDVSEAAVSPDELVHRIHEECRSRGVTLQEFEDIVGWRLIECIERHTDCLRR